MKTLLSCVRAFGLRASHRPYSTNANIMAYRAQLFELEKQRQMKEIERLEKIEVKTVTQNEEIVLVMNKDLSTPFNCAMHISELLCKQSVLAQVNNDLVWDMHRPLKESCSLKFLNFKDQDPTHVNNAYWRSCSFLLGYLLESAFKDQYFVDLCSFPPPNIQSGSFVYDAKINVGKWTPNKQELRCLSVAALKLVSNGLSFERLEINADLAKEMFKYNKYKLEQIPSILAKQESITVYKLGDFVDISKGPMISNSAQIGRFEVTGLFDLETSAYGNVQRIQGVSVPTQLQLHSWTFNLLAERAAKLNKSFLPPEPQKASISQ